MTHSISLTKKVGLFAVIAFLFGLVVLPTPTFAAGGVGDACTAAEPCGTGLQCTDGYCEEKDSSGNDDGTAGSTCKSSLDCDSGLTCNSSGKCESDAFGINPVGNEVAGKLGNKDLRETAASLINVLLGLLGLIAVVIVLAGGFKWMTAGGSEDKIAEARKMIFSGVIGLAIILSAWAISLFVINQLSSATGSTADLPDAAG